LDWADREDRLGKEELAMAKRMSPKQVIAKLRQIELLVAQGKSTALACKEAGVVEQTYYRWRKEYGGLGLGRPRG
jgi:transposase-like protein